MIGSVSALIVAGGRATRLGGVDKRELVVDGEPIFARQLRALEGRVAEVLVSARAPVAGWRTVADVIVDGGPLAGIAAGLAAATTEWLLVLAGDMPHVTGALVDLLVRHATSSCDVVGVRVGERPEPLLCVLRVATVYASVDTMLGAGQRAVHALLSSSALRVAWVPEGALRALDPELRCLTNVNTPDDLRVRAPA